MTDENLWLEDIHGKAPLTWAAERSAETLAQFASPQFDALAVRLLEVIDSDDRIPIVSRRGAHYYNFWRDREHPRGIWRRTTLESYRSADTDWELLLDVDELGRHEGAEWVFSGAKLLPHDYTRALVALSPRLVDQRHGRLERLPAAARKYPLVGGFDARHHLSRRSRRISAMDDVGLQLCQGHGTSRAHGLRYEVEIRPLNSDGAWPPSNRRKAPGVDPARDRGLAHTQVRCRFSDGAVLWFVSLRRYHTCS